MPGLAGCRPFWSVLLPNIYADEFERVARTAFSMWNRDPASPSYGSFDRQYWGWKYKDFSDATLQYAVRLAVEYAKHFDKTSMLPSLLDGYVTFCGNIQRRDGSFDQCYPYERTPGVVYDILSTLIYVRQSPSLISDKSRAELEDIIANAARFALRTDEKHGLIANHLAEYAYELFNFADYASDDRARSKAENYLERTLSLFEADEGWFHEYDGPDAGYQTRTLRYLAKIAALLDKPGLWDVIRKSADFVGELLMPDGSIHPMLGSRSTAIIYPSAFETLAAHDDRYRALADRVCSAWQHARVPLPSQIDFGNAIRLAHDALDAAIARSGKPDPNSIVSASLSNSDFPKAGISIRRNSQREFYLGYRLGGVIVVYAQEGDGSWKLAYEDSGYLLKSPKPAEIWVTRIPGSGRLLECPAGHWVVVAGFQRSLHDELTPARMLMLRLLNLTFLRIQWIGDLFRKVVVRHLMSGRAAVPLELKRDIVIEETLIRVTDSITGDAGFIAGQGMTLYLCRRVTGTHMASARYFQEQELEKIDIAWLQEMPSSLNSTMSRVVSTARPTR